MNERKVGWGRVASLVDIVCEGSIDILVDSSRPGLGPVNLRMPLGAHEGEGDAFH